ncbi:phage tail length tape measure family protein [Mesorhizobium sp. B2-6-1]|uniref:phage tail length tape measure family protein n=1 Tax=Mesorhizobium sp. B2-6-1 TaxID=2589916 RepID=UPI0011286BFA|nr:phage tail length tape measure family protein [Mesorhizobium sp. B2-6-1]TPJ60821.1 hypothetical protein FJ443_19975 [Mesorhizobium sp. B2-6-1]
MTVQLSSLRVSADIDASKYVAGAQQKVAADAAMTASSRNAAVGIAAVGTAVGAAAPKISESGDVLARLSRQYVEGFAASQKFNSAINQLAKGVDTGKIAITQTGPILDGIYKKFGQTADSSAIMARGQTELALAVTAANARFVAARKPLDEVGNSARLTSGQLLNLSRQGNDVITMFALGAPLMQVFASQAGQVFDALESGPAGALGSLKAIGGGLLSFVATPLGAVTVATTAAVAGLAAYATFGREHIRDVDEVLKDHEKNIRALKDAYGEAADSAIAYGKAASNEGRAGIAIPTAITELELRLSLAEATRTASRSMTANANGLQGGSQFGPSVTSQFKDFAAEIDKFQGTIAQGNPDLLAFRKAITEKWDLDRNNEALTNEASALLKLTDAAAKAALALPAAKAAIDALNNGRYPSFADIQPRQDYEDRNSANLTWMERQRAAALGGIGAKSPNQLRAAAMATEAARPSAAGESDDVRQYRIASAGALAYAQAVHSLAEAQKDRARALDQTLAGQQLDLDLVGKTAGEAARLRMEFDQIAQLRAEAARNGVAADEQEIERIKEKAAEYGKFADQIARANLSRDLAFERDQLGRTSQEQAIASRLRGAGLPVDLNSPEAQRMRSNQVFSDNKEMATSFLNDFKSELLKNGGNIGKALGTSILNALTHSMDKQWEAIFDRLGTAFANWMSGGKGAGGALGAGSGIVGAVLGGANDNYAPGAVTRAPLGATGGSMAQYAAAIRSIESAGSGGYSALGPVLKNGNQALGAYQVMKSNLPSWSQDALGKTLSPSQFLADSGAQDAIFAKQFGKYLSKYGNPQDAASAWFTGRPLSSGAGARDVLGTTGSVYVDKFNAAVDKAAGSLGGLDSSVSNTVQALAGGIGGKGGLASILDGLKPSNFQANTTLSDILGYSGGGAAAPSGGGGGFLSSIFSFIPKLFGFADGTESAPEGWAWVGERGPELRRLRAGDTIRSNARSMQMASAGNSNRQPNVELHVHVNGASGDDHIRTLSKQGAQEAIGEYHQGQVNGGFGDTQRRYTSQKG